MLIAVETSSVINNEQGHGVARGGTPDADMSRLRRERS